MKKVIELRKKIDGIDQEILGLIGQRLSIVAQIGKEKRARGLGVVDKKREEMILEGLIKAGKEKGVSQEAIEKIWGVLIRESYILEEK
jgi:chorismate mutase/prephenate dehydrogenase